MRNLAALSDPLGKYTHLMGLQVGQHERSLRGRRPCQRRAPIRAAIDGRMPSPTRARYSARWWTRSHSSLKSGSPEIRDQSCIRATGLVRISADPGF